jgi:hypothetical protein
VPSFFGVDVCRAHRTFPTCMPVQWHCEAHSHSTVHTLYGAFSCMRVSLPTGNTVCGRLLRERSLPLSLGFRGRPLRHRVPMRGLIFARCAQVVAHGTGRKL